MSETEILTSVETDEADYDVADEIRDIIISLLVGTERGQVVAQNIDNPPDDVVIVPAVMMTFVFDKSRCERVKEKVRSIIDKVVPDVFLRKKDNSGGGGSSLMALPFDKKERQWGEQRNADELVALAIATGLGGFCLENRDTWVEFPGGLPYVWFQID